MSVYHVHLTWSFGAMEGSDSVFWSRALHFFLHHCTVITPLFNCKKLDLYFFKDGKSGVSGVCVCVILVASGGGRL